MIPVAYHDGGKCFSLLEHERYMIANILILGFIKMTNSNPCSVRGAQGLDHLHSRRLSIAVSTTGEHT